MSTAHLLRVSDVSCSFSGKRVFGPKSTVKAVDGVSLHVDKGETLGLVGESGSGKSTTGRMVLGMITPSQGMIEFDGTDMASLRGRDWRASRRDMQMIFQDPTGALDPRMTIGDQILEVISVHKRAETTAHKLDLMHSMLDRVGLDGIRYARRYPRELSGGQRQRAVIARALAIGPKMIVCDEPVSALDVSVQAQIVALLVEAQKAADIGYLFISHDLRVIRQVSHRVAVMYLGRIVETAPVGELFDNPQHPYTRALLASVPSIDDARDLQTKAIAGEPPNPRNIPKGCRFHPRCPIARDVCRNVDPAAVTVSAGHDVACHFATSQGGTA
ncbi:ABC transporter ATP-binding protein [Rhizobium sp.]